LTSPFQTGGLWAHADARTTVFARKLIVDCVLAGHRPGEVAKQLGVSRQTVAKWVRRWRAEGLTGLADRSSQPHRLARLTNCPGVRGSTSASTVRPSSASPEVDIPTAPQRPWVASAGQSTRYDQRRDSPDWAGSQ
jgi:transposase-like protein